MAGRHPNPNYYISDRQAWFLRKLLNEAFGAHYHHGLRLDSHHLDTLPRAEASKAIDTLVKAKQNGWK